MDIIIAVIMLSLGLFLIIKGGDLFVDSSKYLARVAHVREIIIGATIVSVGTTMPELLTSIMATIRGISAGGDSGYFSLAISNAVGSMMCNSGLILAIVLLVRPPRYQGKVFCKTSIYVLLITILIVIFVMTGSRISMWEGMTLLAIFIIYTICSVLDAKSQRTSLDDMAAYAMAKEESKAKMIAFFIVGAVGIGVGAMLLVDNAKYLATSMGISEQLVGVTLVAVGTSLPELVTSITSLRKGSSDIGVGNIMGAHVINATLILGIIAVISRSGMAVDIVTRDVAVWVLLAIMCVLILPTMISRKFYRWQGGVMLAMYLLFVGYNVYITLN